MALIRQAMPVSTQPSEVVVRTMWGWVGPFLHFELSPLHSTRLSVQANGDWFAWYCWWEQEANIFLPSFQKGQRGSWKPLQDAVSEERILQQKKMFCFVFYSIPASKHPFGRFLAWGQVEGGLAEFKHYTRLQSCMQVSLIAFIALVFPAKNGNNDASLTGPFTQELTVHAIEKTLYTEMSGGASSFCTSSFLLSITCAALLW